MSIRSHCSWGCHLGQGNGILHIASAVEKKQSLSLQECKMILWVQGGCNSALNFAVSQEELDV